MPVHLETSQPDFAKAFQRLVNTKREDVHDVRAAVAEMIASVRQRGDAALIELTEKYDRLKLSAATIRLSQAEIETAIGRCPQDQAAALKIAAARIEAFHKKGLPQDHRYVDAQGISLGWRWSPIDAVGIYVPGGRAAYPSSVLMNAIPARVAGVQRIAMVVPMPEGTINPLVVMAAQMAGVTEIYRVGGAQAVAALAYGTASIAPVDKITGPGNAYVAEAKRQVFGTVGIDMIAGPSEILVIADAKNNPDIIAADLLSQAEHDPSAQSILITDSAAFADAVVRAIETQLKTLPTKQVAAASWRDWGAMIIVRNWQEAIELTNQLAPEHLEIATDDPETLAAQVRHAGSIFIGRYTPEAVGDYIAGPNHVLPTARSARFSSGLQVLDFMKRSTMLACSEQSLKAIGPYAATLADAEGLPAHAVSIRKRL